MEKKVERLIEAVSSIMESTTCSWDGKRQAFVDVLAEDDKGIFNEFMAWFPEELD